jgi:hypothetical protein
VHLKETHARSSLSDPNAGATCTAGACTTQPSVWIYRKTSDYRSHTLRTRVDHWAIARPDHLSAETGPCLIRHDDRLHEAATDRLANALRHLMLPTTILEVARLSK